MVPYVDFQFVLPKTAGLAMWWWFGWLLIGSVSIYLLFSWWVNRQAVREDELDAKGGPENQLHAGPSHGHGGQEGPNGTA